jgi:hypothetical protein
MYAEQFNAPTWLEGPAQWLWWTMQSRINGNLKDAKYNLDQFWTALGQMKAGATEATWPEILALDSQSHIQAANITGAIINEMERDYNNYAFMFNFPLIGKAGQIVTPPAAAVKAQQDQRLKELQTAAALAEQAQTAAASRVVAVAENRISYDEAERAQENTQIDRITRDQSSDLLGIPLWAWGIGAAALLYLVSRR